MGGVIFLRRELTIELHSCKTVTETIYLLLLQQLSCLQQMMHGLSHYLPLIGWLKQKMTKQEISVREFDFRLNK